MPYNITSLSQEVQLGVAAPVRSSILISLILHLYDVSPPHGLCGHMLAPVLVCVQFCCMARTCKRSTYSPVPQTCNCGALSRSARKRSRRAECGGATTHVSCAPQGAYSGRTKLAPGEAWKRGRATPGCGFHEGNPSSQKRSNSRFAFPRFVCWVSSDFFLSFLVKSLACGAPP